MNAESHGAVVTAHHSMEMMGLVSCGEFEKRVSDAWRPCLPATISLHFKIRFFHSRNELRSPVR